MLKIDKDMIQHLNQIGFRDSFGKAILDIGENRPDVIVIAADLSDACRVTEFGNQYPDRFFQVGIAEQNMVGIAAGLALSGFTVFTTTFATFASLRCCEQVRTDTAYPNLNVKALGIDSGVTCGTLGTTHFAIEDMGVLRCMPNMVILSPADGIETFKVAWAAVQHEGPVYIRLSGGKNLQGVYEKDYDFEIGKSITLKEGDDLTLFATGLMAPRAMAAATDLTKNGIHARVINMHTIKPIDANAIIQAAEETNLIVTVEEHVPFGGLGSAVAEVMAAQGTGRRLLKISLPDEFPNIGTHEQILSRYGLTGLGIFETVLKNYKSLN